MLLGLTFLLSTVATTALALDPIYTSRFSSLALKGYDAVSYFTQSKAVEGDKSITHEWQGATWRFANIANRDLFAADPAKYAPQYGGYCAWAVSRNSTASGDPEVWTVQNGKLYINYSKKIEKTWSQDIAGNVAKADTHWPGLLDE